MDFSERLDNLYEQLERLVEEVASADEALGARLRERLDAASPAFDDMGNLLDRWEAEQEKAE